MYIVFSFDVLTSHLIIITPVTLPVACEVLLFHFIDEQTKAQRLGDLLMAKWKLKLGIFL